MKIVLSAVSSRDRTEVPFRNRFIVEIIFLEVDPTLCTTTAIPTVMYAQYVHPAKLQSFEHYSELAELLETKSP